MIRSDCLDALARLKEWESCLLSGDSDGDRRCLSRLSIVIGARAQSRRRLRWSVPELVSCPWGAGSPHHHSLAWADVRAVGVCPAEHLATVSLRMGADEGSPSAWLAGVGGLRTAAVLAVASGEHPPRRSGGTHRDQGDARADRRQETSGAKDRLFGNLIRPSHRRRNVYDSMAQDHARLRAIGLSSAARHGLQSALKTPVGLRIATSSARHSWCWIAGPISPRQLIWQVSILADSGVILARRLVATGASHLEAC
ncbi:hypothetical protein O181_064355 [Austropuccinia psidii MF-1]|uniref:Uncharacterized protein n=1 Tax=Austropuccinia psidii MF-1 TaxID=1389203 RepID=A0A9Q3EKC9_9BASI|nr:hypothetical protein [Austropuccinia psidii MF-1]